MPRSYRHVSDYEKEIFALRIKGYTNRAIGEALGFNEEQIKNFIRRYNRKQRKIVAGETIHKKDRPSKKGNDLPPSIQQRPLCRSVKSASKYALLLSENLRYRAE